MYGGELLLSLLFALPVQLTHDKEYETALWIFRSVNSNHPSYIFHQGVCEYRLLQHQEAKKTFQKLTESFNQDEIPERYLIVSQMLLDDMSQWKAEDLGDIGRRMSEVTDRIENKKIGDETQNKQREIVKLLDKLIKEKEDELKKQQEQQAQAQQKQQEKAIEPQQDSVPGYDAGPGKVDEKRLLQMAEVWGKLPEKERHKAMQDMVIGMPPRYREVIEQYFRNLAK